MKRIIGLSAIIGLFILSGCLDTVEETTFKDDGSGIYVSTADMSKMFTLLSAMGGADNEKMKDIEKLAYDTTMSLLDMADSSTKLTPDERKLIEKGTARLIMNYKKEQFLVSFSIPFSKPADIMAINNLLKSSKGDAFNKQLKKAFPGDNKGGDDEDMPMMGDGEGQPDLNSYFDFTYEKSKLKRKINKEQYAKVKDDKNLQSLMEMGQMGMPVNFKTIINLPKAAKKAEGKGVKLSDDKKTVTIEATLDDFMEDASKFEYEIEY